MSALRLPVEEILAPDAGDAPGRPIGRSREGREIAGHLLGHGPLHVSLIGGCHADEPVGPAMLRRLAAWLASRPAEDPLLSAATWYLVPHVNPDGETLNAVWSGVTLPAVDHLGAEDRAYDLPLYLRHVVRERPGDDMEFGFPRGGDDSEARPENQAVAAFLAQGAPFHLHASFHSIAFATGPWFLIEPAWIERTGDLRRALRERVYAMGYRLFDVDRGGEKGFRRIEEGFSTRPDSASMRVWFEERGEPGMAALFRPSSMEYVRSLGGDPFTLVSEMPLFLRPLEEGETGRPDDPRFLAWRGRLAACSTDEEVRAEAGRSGVRGMPLRDQMRLQLAFLNEALTAVGR
ncbi:MAG TPA: M14 family zinc carboxypeptidase [Thermoanaerobaculia bacterium]